MAIISMEVENPYGGSFKQVLRTDDRYSNRTPHAIAYDLYGEALISVNKTKKDLENTTDGTTFVTKGKEMRKSIVKDSSRKSRKTQR